MIAFLTQLISLYNFIPSSVLCMLPMKNKLRYGRKRTILDMALLFAVMLSISAYLKARLKLPYNTLFPFILIICFIFYYKHVTAHISKLLAVFMLSCALMAFISNFANGFDALIHPTSGLNDFSLEAAIFQTLLSTAFTAVISYPFYRHGSFLIDNFEPHRVWYITLPVSGSFLAVNLFITPFKYETLYVNRIFLAFWSLLGFMLVLLLLLCVIFYFIVYDMIGSQKIYERNSLLEMQESQYMMLKRYIGETDRQRHDFKHAIRTLDNLASEGNLSAIRKYLDGQLEAMPKNESKFFCDNMAVNAILNHYLQLTHTLDIRTTWTIDLPEKLSLPDNDLCGILGNILENAVIACEDVPESSRFIDLSIKSEPEAALYIVATNSFNGEVKLKDGRYLSTHRHGSGIGLTSVISTAESYGGMARFTHDKNQFMSDVMLPA